MGTHIAGGAIGAVVLVLLSRVAGPEMFAGYMASIVVAALGAVGGVFVKRQIMKPKAVPVRARARRWIRQLALRRPIMSKPTAATSTAPLMMY